MFQWIFLFSINQTRAAACQNQEFILMYPLPRRSTAEALGARWDVDDKKWYVPSNKDVTLFAQWHAETSLLETNVAAKSMSRPKETSAKCGLLADTTDKAMMTLSGG